MKDHIVQIGEQVLRDKAQPVAKKDIGSKELKALITKMKKALNKEDYGVAIAAPQLGASLRLFIVAGRVFEKDSDEKEGEKKATSKDRVYINPEITRRSKKKVEMAEGCLSVRGQYGTVLRHEKATLKALDENGKPILQHASGLLAHIFQHETDHLEGILFVDKTLTLEPWDDHKSKEDSKNL